MPVWLEAGAIFGGMFVILVAIIATAVVKFFRNYNDSLVESAQVQGGIIKILQKGESVAEPRRISRELTNGDVQHSVAVDA